MTRPGAPYRASALARVTPEPAPPRVTRTVQSVCLLCEGTGRYRPQRQPLVELYRSAELIVYQPGPVVHDAPVTCPSCGGLGFNERERPLGPVGRFLVRLVWRARHGRWP